MKLLQRTKGTLELEFPDRPYGPNEFVAGSVGINARRFLGPGTITVDLVCVSSQQRWDGERRLHIDKAHLFRGPLVRDEHATATPDGPNRWSFTFQVPSLAPRRGEGIPNWSCAVPHLIRALGSWDTTVEWTLEAHFDIPGIDLAARKTIPLFLDSSWRDPA